MNYAIFIVAFLALALGYLRYRRPGRRKFQYHERFRSIRVLDPETDPVVRGFENHLWK